MATDTPDTPVRPYSPECPGCRYHQSYPRTPLGVFERNCSRCQLRLLVVIGPTQCEVYRNNLRKVLECLRNSRLLDPAALEAVERIRWKSLRDLWDHLVDHAGLTEWQVEKLLQQKFKGFYLGGGESHDEFRLRDALSEEMYQATQVSTGKTFNVLMIYSTDEAYLAAQAKTLALEHPLLVPGRIGTEVRRPTYLAFEPQGRVSLHQHVYSIGTLPEQQGIAMLLTLCEAVEYLEQHGGPKRLRLIPEHVFVNPDEPDSTRLLAVARRPPGLTLDGPNDFDGPAVYGLGCILCFALTKSPETWYHIAVPKLSPTDERFSPRLVALILRMIDRTLPKSIGEVVRELRAIQSGQTR